MASDPRRRPTAADAGVHRLAAGPSGHRRRSYQLGGAHRRTLEKKITLSKALATLGQGTDLVDLLEIIKRPGWTTPAECAFCMALLDGMQAHADALASLSARLLAASKVVASAE